MAKHKKDSLGTKNNLEDKVEILDQKLDTDAKGNVKNDDTISEINVPVPDVSIDALTSTTDSDAKIEEIVPIKVKKQKSFSLKKINIFDNNSLMWLATGLFLILYAWIFTMLFIYVSPKHVDGNFQAINAVFVAKAVGDGFSYSLTPTAIGFIVVLIVFFITAGLGLTSKMKYHRHLFDNKLAHSKIFLIWSTIIFISFIAMVVMALVPPFLDNYETAVIWSGWASNNWKTFNGHPTAEQLIKGESFLDYLGVSYDPKNAQETINTISDQIKIYPIHTSYSLVWETTNTGTNVFSVGGIAALSIFSICLITIPLLTPILLLVLNASEIKEMAKQSNKKRLQGLSNKISKMKQKNIDRKDRKNKDLEDLVLDEDNNILTKNLKDVKPKKIKNIKVKHPDVPIEGLTTPITNDQNSNADTQAAKNIRKNKKQKIATPDKELEDIFDNLDI